MAGRMFHRGPDAEGFFLDEHMGFAFRRLGIIDLESGDQPIYSEDRSLVMIANGEIFNYKELKEDLLKRNHQFYTQTDVEVLVHLYEDHGPACVKKLNGQFAFAVWDRRERTLFLTRDHLGICPLYYTEVEGAFVFGSEIKAILEHPGVERRVELTGLDQVFTFPGLVSPHTLFHDIRRLENGHYLLVRETGVVDREYWDLVYPTCDEALPARPESYYVEALAEIFQRSVAYRLQADVPVGFYLSGGLDSSLIAAAIHRLAPDQRRHAFAINFADQEADERQYQEIMARQVKCYLHEHRFDWRRTSELMHDMVYHAECPVKETYNTCSMVLSRMAREHGVKVILTGEGADELFAGYIGYRLDALRSPSPGSSSFEEILEEELRQRLWGTPDLFYEHNYHALGETKQALYATEVRRGFAAFDCLREPVVRKDRLENRHPLHQRSYLDYKLRMADHLLMDHGDQMALAHSVEARYPFLDVDLVEFARQMPPELKLNGFREKYVLRKMGEGMLPASILDREKFGWYAPGSPQLLQAGVEWIQDVLSYDRISRQGYFDPDVIERIKTQYQKPGFRLNQPYECDVLIVVASFGLLLDAFDLPDAGVGALAPTARYPATLSS